MNETLLEKIEEYLNGEMSAEEALHFREEIAGDKELASFFSIYSSIETEMRDSERYGKEEAALKETLSKLTAVHFKNDNHTNERVASGGEKNIPVTGLAGKKITGEKHKVRELNIWKTLLVAASTLGVIALGISLYWSNIKKDQVIAGNKETPNTTGNTDTTETASLGKDTASERLPGKEGGITDADRKDQVPESTTNKQQVLYAQNFSPDPVPMVKDEFLADAYSYYENKEYKNAIKAFDNADLTFVSRGNETDTALRKFYVHYYKAQSYMVINNFENAIAELKGAIDQDIDSLEVKAQWYLALAYLHKNDRKKTDSVLNIIATNEANPEYRSKAQTLQKELLKLK